MPSLFTNHIETCFGLLCTLQFLSSSRSFFVSCATQHLHIVLGFNSEKLRNKDIGWTLCYRLFKGKVLFSFFLFYSMSFVFEVTKNKVTKPQEGTIISFSQTSSARSVTVELRCALGVKCL